jgi:hypothetical protein
MMAYIHTLLLLLLICWLPACAVGTNLAALPTAAPTAALPPTIQPTLVSTIPRQIQSIPTPTFTPDTRSTDCQPGAGDSANQHQVVATVDYQARTVIVQQTLTWFNRGDTALDQLVLNAKPNERPGVFVLNTLTLRFGTPDYQFNGQQLTVSLPEALEPGCSLTLNLTYQLNIPPIGDRTTDGYLGYLGYGNRQLNLGRWLLSVAARQSERWVSHEATSIGEHDIDELADYDVTLNLQNAPENLRVAAPGEPVEVSQSRWRFRLAQAREFSASLSPFYILTAAQTRSGAMVELYSFDDARIVAEGGTVDSAAFALDVASRSLDRYTELFGPYPYSRLVIVQSDFPDGMEFSGLVFVGGEYFRNFRGPQSYLMLITTHEVAHQWWYQQIGNDQALNPWLDEALATYSEHLFIESQFPALSQWWWDFRINTYSPQGFVDSSVYEFSSRREYINAVYLRGVRMLGDLRAALGDAAFLDWLRRYANQANGQISSPALFWSLLTPEQYTATEAIRQRYLRNPQIIVLAPGS